MAQDRVIRFRGAFDINEIISQLSKVQQRLNGLSINNQLDKGIDKSLSGLIQKAERMSAEMETGFTTPAQLDSFLKKIRDFQIELNQTANNVQKLDIGFSELKLPETVANQFKDLSDKISQTEGDIDKLKNKASEMAAKLATEKGIGISDKELSSIQAAIGDNEKLNAVIEKQVQSRQKKINQEISNKGSLDKEIEDNRKLLEQIEAQREARKKMLTEKLGSYSQREARGEKLSGAEKGWQTRYRKELDSMERGEDSYSLKKKDIQKETKGLETKSANAEKRIQNMQTALQRIQQFFNTIQGKSENIVSSKEAGEFQEIASQVAVLEKELERANEEKKEFVQTQINQAKGNIDEESQKLREYSQRCEEAAQENRNLKASMEQLNKTGQFFNNLKSYATRIFGVAQAFMYMRQVVSRAFTAIKELDEAFTEIAVVTSKTTDQLWESFDTYNQMAQKLGVTTVDAIKTSALYYQQGLQTAEVMTLTEETLKMAQIAGMDFAKAN